MGISEHIEVITKHLVANNHHSYDQKYGWIDGYCTATKLFLPQVITAINDDGVVDGGTLRVKG